MPTCSGGTKKGERTMPDTPTPQTTPTADQIAEAMQDAWNNFCADAQAHPDCFYREGRQLFADFQRGTYASQVARQLRFIVERDNGR